MDSQQERELARQLRQGSAEAWRHLYEAYSHRVWRSVARLMGPKSADTADALLKPRLGWAGIGLAENTKHEKLGLGIVWTVVIFTNE